MESKRSERSEGCCINPSGRNRTSDQLISEHTDTQHPTLQSIALPTELHSVLHTPHAKRKKNVYALLHELSQLRRCTPLHNSPASALRHLVCVLKLSLRYIWTRSTDDRMHHIQNTGECSAIVVCDVISRKSIFGSGRYGIDQ